MTPRDNAITAASAVRPEAAVSSAFPSGLEMAHVEARRRSGQFEFRVRLSADNPLRSCRARSFPSPHGNKRMLPPAYWNSSAGPLYGATKAMPASTDAGAVPLKCDSQVAGPRVALRYTFPSIHCAVFHSAPTGNREKSADVPQRLPESHCAFLSVSLT